MSFDYPLTFNCEEDLIKHIQTNRKFYETVLDKQFEKEKEQFKKEQEQFKKEKIENETKLKEKEDQIRKENETKLKEQEEQIRKENETKLKEQEEQIRKENESKLKEQEEKYKKQINLHRNSDNSTGSYYLGEQNEQVFQEVIQQKFTNWTIDKGKKMKCMDIRMSHKIRKISVSIECKNKKKLTKNDLTKFTADKSTNNFDGHIFISNCVIPNMLKVEGCMIKDDNLYIYSNNINTILNYIEVYISNLSTNNTENTIKLEDVETLYNNHNQQKKELLKQDKVFLTMMHDKVLLKNHLYITTKSNCKSGKPPY